MWRRGVLAAVACLVLGGLIGVGVAAAQVPMQITYQGYLTTGTGQPVTIPRPSFSGSTPPPRAGRPSDRRPMRTCR